ncbi:MAG: Ig-like domain-containing protein [Xanthobacteraceae bacterium]
MILIVLSACIAVSPATASCFVSKVHYRLKGNTVEAYGQLRAGQSCNHSRGASSGTTFTGFSIVDSPKHGQLTRRESLSVRYQPNPGYRGPDSYALQICGHGRSSGGCSTIRYSMTVE